MNRFFGYAQDNPSGKRAPGATITVYNSGLLTTPSLFQDAAGATPLGNPFLADVNAYFDFYLAQPGRIDVSMSGAGITTPFTLGDFVPQPIFPATPVYNVQFYGSVGDGATDDTVAVQAAITAAVVNGKGIVYFPPATYRLTGQLSCFGSSNIQFLGDNRATTILSWDDNATKGLYIDTLTKAADISSLLTVDAAVSDRSITVAAGGIFTQGAWVLLQDSEGKTTSLLSRIASIAGNVLTLEDAVPGPLTVAQAATCYSYPTHPLLGGIVVDSLTLQTNATTPTQKLTLLEIARCFGAVVRNAQFVGAAAPLITPLNNRDGVIDNCLFEKAYTVAGAAIETQNSTGMLVRDNFTRLCQFGITFLASPYCRTQGNTINGRATSVALGRGIKYQSSSNFGNLSGNNISDTNLYGIYLSDSAYCTVTANTVSFTGSGSDVGEHGIQFGGFENAGAHHNTLSGNTVVGASGYGIAINTGLNGADTFNVITGNTIQACVQGGIFCNASRNVIGQNFCNGLSTTVGGVIRVTFNGSFNSIIGNVITCTGASPPAITTVGGNGGHLIAGNIVDALAISINAGAATPDLNLATSTDLTTQIAAVKVKLPAISVTAVGTPANLVETTAWDVLIPGGTLNVAPQGFVVRALLSAAADANNKTVTVYVGTATLSGTTTGNNIVLLVEVHAAFIVGGTVFFTVTMYAGSTIFRGAFVTSFDNWAADQHFKITMTNGVAIANDIIFRTGDLIWEGVPSGAYS